MLWLYTVYVRIPLIFRKIVICDRYIYDTLVDLKIRYGIDQNSNDGKIFNYLITNLSPKPDLSFLLMISEEEAFNRKNVNNDEKKIVEEQINQYKNISKRYNLFTINTGENMSIEKVVNRITKETLENYYNKWPRKKLRNWI